MLYAKNPIAIVLACVLATGAAGALARPPGGHSLGADRADMHLERMAERLDLTEAQQDEIRAILAEHHEATGAERARLRQHIDAVLTDEQRSLRDQQMQSGLERRLDRMAERLDLTDAQREEMRAIMAEKHTNPELTPKDLRERMAAVLTDEQREQLTQTRHRHRGGEGHGPGPALGWGGEGGRW